MTTIKEENLLYLHRTDNREFALMALLPGPGPTWEGIKKKTRSVMVMILDADDGHDDQDLIH